MNHVVQLGYHVEQRTGDVLQIDRASADFQLALGQQVTLEDIASHLPEDLSRQVLIHLTSQPRAWPLWLKQAGIAEMTPRGQLWLDSVPAMLEAAEQGLGVTLAMAP